MSENNNLPMMPEIVRDNLTHAFRNKDVKYIKDFNNDWFRYIAEVQALLSKREL
jgi:hypothetical protein